KTTLINRMRGQLGADAVTWLPQRVALVPGTILGNIVGPVGVHDSAALAKAVELAALDDVALDHEVSSGSTGLSGGQAQRVTLARAFYRAITRQTEWLLLDEPLSALDSGRAAVVAESAAWFAAQGVRVVVVSHQPFTPVNMADLAVNTVAVTDVA
ncbi:MAG: ATP-binding cassette domain-containing protein, partial [Micrococcales bacterium]